MRKLIAAAMLVTGCSQQPSAVPADDISEARRDVARKLREPESAKFDQLAEVRDGIVCGTVRGRNGFGGYGDRAPFVWIRSDMTAPGDSSVTSGAHLAGDEVDGFIDKAGQWQQTNFVMLRRFARC